MDGWEVGRMENVIKWKIWGRECKQNEEQEGNAWKMKEMIGKNKASCSSEALNWEKNWEDNQTTNAKEGGKESKATEQYTPLIGI